jgi:hypothetical protein
MTSVPTQRPIPATAGRASSGRQSGVRLCLEGLAGQRRGSRTRQEAVPRSRFRVVVAGWRGHGRATAIAPFGRDRASLLPLSALPDERFP